MKDKKKQSFSSSTYKRKKHYKTNHLFNKTFLDLIHNYRIIEKKSILQRFDTSLANA